MQTSNLDTSRLEILAPAAVRRFQVVGQSMNRQQRRAFARLVRQYKTKQHQRLQIQLQRRRVVVADIGKVQAHFYVAHSDIGVDESVISHDQLLNLEIPGLEEGDILIIEKAHLCARNPRSKSQTFTYEQLSQLFELAEEKGILIYAFPHRQTPKARGFILGSAEKPTSDYFDCKAIAEYCIRHPNLASLSEFYPLSDSDFEQLKSRKSNFIETLNEDINAQRAVDYSYSDDSHPLNTLVQEARDYLYRIATESGDIDYQILEILKLEPKAKTPGLKKNKTSYNRICYILMLFFRPDGSFRSDRESTWSYIKQHVLGSSPYHQCAGVAASNVKYWLHSKLKEFRVERPLIDKDGSGKNDDKEKKAYAPWDAETQLELTEKRAAFWRFIRKLWSHLNDFTEMKRAQAA